MGYRLAIADDEKLIRESLAQFIDWKELGFEIVLLAEDGIPVIEALRQEKLDAVLCDIQMQEKTGLDVAEFIYRNSLDCIIVLLSGYEEFEYARQAISFNVTEYLLKPINLSGIRETFTRIKTELDTRGAEREKQRQLLQNAGSFWHIIIERMLERGRLGIITDGKGCRDFLRSYHIEETVLSHTAYIIQLQLEGLEEYSGLEHNIITNILELLEEGNQLEGSFILFGEDEKQYRVLILRNQPFEKEHEEKYLREVAEAIKDICRIKAELRFLLKNITLEEAAVKMKECFPLFEQVQKTENNGEGYLNTIARQYLLILNMCSDYREIEENIGRIYDLRNKNLQSRENISEIFRRMRAMLKEQHPEKMETFPAEWVAGENPETFFRNTMEFFYRYLHEDGDYLSLPDSIKKLVGDHIGESISLTAAASHVFLSPNYFSRLFKEQTGENYSEYCIRIKMERAAELLCNPRKKIYEISEELGYKNIKYFYKLFKRNYNCTPTEYRESCWQKSAQKKD